MTSIQTLSRRSLDELETELISLSTRINAAEYEFLVLVREFDLRQGWKACHFNNCAEWLDLKCGIAANPAREKVRVAQGYLAGGRDNGTCTADHYQVVVHAAAVAVDEKALRGASGKNAPREASDRYTAREARDEKTPGEARGGTGKSDLPIESVRRLCCDASLGTVNENGSALHVGRKQRRVPQALRRALYARDRACRFPGCTHSCGHAPIPAAR